MSEEPQSVWKKPWKGARGLLLWFLILACAIFVVVFALGLLSADSSLKEVRDFALFLSIGIPAAGFLLVIGLRWLFCWRNLKRVLFGFACLATLIALFYAEENWRGKRAWENYKREWEAKGEKFDLVSLAPKPVPDDQNFAMTPLWVEEVSGMMGMTNAMTWYGDRVTALGHTNFVRPLDIPAELRQRKFTNQMHGWQQAEKADLRAWQHYYRTPVDQKFDPNEEFAKRYGLPVKSIGKSGLKVITNNFPVSPQEQTPSADVLLALSKYDAIIEVLRKAARQPYSRFPLGYTDDDPAGILLPHLASLKGCTITLQLRAVAELQAVQIETALDDTQLMFRMTESIRGEPFLISQLIRIAMWQIAMQPVWEGLADHKWTDAQLAALDANLAKLDFLSDYQLAIRGERALWIGEIDYLRRNRNQIANIKEMAHSFDEDENAQHADKLGFQMTLFRLAPGGWFEQNKISTAKMYTDYLLPIINLTTHVYSSAAEAQAGESVAELLKNRSAYNWFTRLLVPKFGKASKKFVRAQSFTDMARISCALERYRLANGQFPDTLDTLAPHFINKIPNDVLDGKPLRYRRTPDSSYLIYSVGWNKTDDGGVAPPPKGASVEWEKKRGPVDPEKGDWVWTYPVK